MKRVNAIRIAVGLAAFSAAVFPAAAQDSVDLKQTQAAMDAMKKKLANATVLSVQGGLMQSIPGAPYSAEQVTSRTQMLGDGTRIHNETRTKVYRDGKGRLRQETPDSITIFDPTNGVGYTLNPATMTYGTIHLSVSGGGNAAYSYSVTGPKVQYFSGFDSPDGKAAAIALDKAHAELALSLDFQKNSTTATDAEKSAVDKAYADGLKAGKGVGGGVSSGVAVGGVGKGVGVGVSTGGNGESVQYFFNTAGPRIAVDKAMLMASKPETLGTRMIEGVNAEGERRTQTIEAGQIGNDRPITIMDEHWFSPELHVEVKYLHSDPRTGEDSTDLINIVRGEPDPSLFQLPAGYQQSTRPLPFKFQQ
jgi:hypothetical protein